VQRFYAATEVAPVWVGLGLAVVFVGVYLAFGWATGILGAIDPSLDPHTSRVRIWWEMLNGLLAAYILTAYVYCVEGAVRDFTDLRPLLPLTDAEFEEHVDRSTHIPAPLPALALLLGGGMAFLMVRFDPGIWGEVGPPEWNHPIYIWVFVRNAIMGWCGWRGALLEMSITRGYAQAARVVSVDLLDTSSLAPFARKGQRSVVVWTGFIVLFSLFWLGGAAARSNPFFLVLVLSLVATVFLVPLIGVHRRLAAAKQQELEHVNERIRSIVSREGLDSGSGPRLSDWTSYRGVIEDAREWPINAPALFRTALFAAIGVGSWLGGAVVERLLGALLD